MHRHLRHPTATLVLLASLVLSSALLAPSANAQTVVATVPVGTFPIRVTYDSGKGEVFVANQHDNTGSVISDSTNATATTTSTTPEFSDSTTRGGCICGACRCYCHLEEAFCKVVRLLGA